MTVMNTNKLTFGLMTSLIMLAACDSIPEPDTSQTEGRSPLEISVTAADGIGTRSIITGTVLGNGSEIGLSFYDASGDTYKNIPYENIRYRASQSASSQTWDSDEPIYVADIPGTLYGYYPFAESVTDICSILISTDSEDQTDYLYAVPVSGITKARNTAEVTMKHALAAVRLSVARGSYSGTGVLTAASVSGEEIATSAVLNATTGKITSPEGFGVAVSPTLEAITLTQEPSFIDILTIPSDDAVSEMKVTLTIDGARYEIIVKDAALKQGIMTEYGIIVNDGEVSITSVTVTAWTQDSAGSQIVQNGHKVSLGGDMNGLAFNNSIDEHGNVTIVAVPYISNDAETKPVTIDGDAALTQSVDDRTGILTVLLSDIASDITVTFNGYYLWMTVTHEVTNVSSPTKLYNSGTVSRIKMDGVEIGTDKNYQFETTGEHVMKIALSSNRIVTSNLFYTIKTITSVVIPEGFENISNWAFSGCTKLKSISLPSTLRSINYQCFCRTIIESIFIPDGCSLTYGLFSGCTALKSVRLPADLKEIPDMLFDECSALTEFNMPEGITRIGESAFRRSGITSLRLPETLTEIPYELCNNCQKLEEVTLPANFTKIGDRAFNNCSSLKRTILSDGTVYEGEFHIPEGVVTLGQLAVMIQSEHIKTIHVPSSLTDVQNGGLSSAMVERYFMTSANPKYDIRNYSVVETATNTLIAGGTESTKIHESVTSIGHSAFYMSKIHTVDLHEGITSIGDRAFYYAYPSIVISRSVTPPTLGSECFWIAQYNGTLKVPEEALAAYTSEWMINQLGYLGWSTARWRIAALTDEEIIL